MWVRAQLALLQILLPLSQKKTVVFHQKKLTKKTIVGVRIYADLDFNKGLNMGHSPSDLSLQLGRSKVPIWPIFKKKFQSNQKKKKQKSTKKEKAVNKIKKKN